MGFEVTPSLCRLVPAEKVARPEPWGHAAGSLRHGSRACSLQPHLQSGSPAKDARCGGGGGGLLFILF